MDKLKNLKYAVNVQNMGKPIDMLVYKGIGGEKGINGSMFAEELTYLSQHLEPAPEEIRVRINSGGGGVMELFSMFSAILNANKMGRVDVNTYVDGIAASSAGLLAMAGKKVFMKDFARMMIHGVSMIDKDGNAVEMSENEKSFMNVLQNMISEAYSGRTGRDKQEIMDLMTNNKDNWFNVKEAIESGLVKEENIENTGLELKEPKETNLAELVNSAGQIINSLTIKPLSMKSVINALKLQEGSSESIILNAVNNLRTELKDKGEELKTAQNKIGELEADNLSLKAQSEENAKNAAKTSVESYINKGVFTPKNEAEKEALIEQAVKNPEAFNAMASMIPVASNKIVTGAQGLGNAGGGEEGEEVSESLKQAINGRSLRELERKAPSVINKMKAENFSVYVNMFNEAYGTNKTAEELRA